MIMACAPLGSARVKFALLSTPRCVPGGAATLTPTFRDEMRDHPTVLGTALLVAGRAAAAVEDGEDGEVTEPPSAVSGEGFDVPTSMKANAETTMADAAFRFMRARIHPVAHARVAGR
jgi:hypothetical protein